MSSPTSETEEAEVRAGSSGSFHTGDKRDGPLANLFQAFVAWTFLLAVVAAFVLLLLMKVSFWPLPTRKSVGHIYVVGFSL